MSHDPSENEGARDEYWDEVEILLACEFHPWNGDNFAEAMGQLSAEDWNCVATYVEKHNINAVSFIHGKVEAYWQNRAENEARAIIAKRNKEAEEESHG